MAIIIRNGIEYAGGGSGGIEITQAEYNALGDKVKTDGVTYFIIDPDEEQSLPENCKVRYVDDPNDENYDWVQVCHNGNWINDHRAYTQRYELYVDQNNGGEFVAYAGTTTDKTPQSPQTTFADTMWLKVSAVAPSGGGGNPCGCVISKAIDLSRFKTLKFNYSGIVVHAVSSDDANSWISIFITQNKLSRMTPIASKNFYTGTSNNAKEGVVELDISELNGEYYIGIELYSSCWSGGTGSAEVTISDFYME